MTHQAKRLVVKAISRRALAATPVAVAAATLLSGLPAFAQTTETVVITGIRRGIESAISVKKNSDGVVEAISAEDIGKLPDTTIAESLARLPGVTTQRTKSGTASVINIRGLGPDFNGYLLNGREQTGIGDSRALDMSVYPAELIGGATVYKTADAALMGGGLAGTLDTRLIDPLAIGRRVVAVSYEKFTTGKGMPVEGSGKRFSLSYVDQFADRKLGVALGFVRTDGTSFEIETGGWGSATVQATLANGTVQNGVTVPGPFGNGLDYKNRRNSDKRDGAAAIISFRPNKDFQSQLDLFWAKQDIYLKEARLQGGLGGPITNATVVNGVAQRGTFAISPGGLVIRSEAIFDADTIQSAGWRTSWKFAPKMTGVLDIGHNSGKRVERDIEAYAGITAADQLTFDLTGGGSVPRLTAQRATDYTNPATIAVRDQSGWSGINGVPQAGYSKGPTLIDKLDSLRFEVKHDLGGSWFTDVTAGVNYVARKKDRITDEGLIVPTAGPTARIPYPGSAYVESDIGGTGFNMLTFDPTADLWPGASIQRKYNDDILSKTWGVKEKVTTAFLKAGIDTTLAGIPVRGNAGVQLVSTNQSGFGYRAKVGSDVTLTNPATELSSAGTTYTDVLPSINLTGELSGGQVLRFGLGEQIARANMTDLRNSFAAAIDPAYRVNNVVTPRYVGSAGNPSLKPFKATALDLSWEKYFGNRGYVSVAGFYKKLHSYITTTTDLSYNFQPYAASLGLSPAPGAQGYIGTFTTTVNGSGGNLSGVEVTASLPFGAFVSALEGLGLTASYSDTHSSVRLPNVLGLNPNQTVPNDGKTIPMPGLSKTNTKLMLYYERAGFSAFVAQNKRSDFVGSVSNDVTGGYPSLKIIEGSSWVSAQIGYEFQQGFMKGLGLRIEGNNLNKPDYRQLNQDGSVDRENKTGAWVGMKVSYKLQW